jgi:hypothetical protein
VIGIEIRIEMFFANQLNEKSLNAPRVAPGDFLISGKTNCVKPICHLASLRLFVLRVKRWAGTDQPLGIGSKLILPTTALLLQEA